MRDHPWHATRILGGMWGVRRGALWTIRTLIARGEPRDYFQSEQDLLRERVYPLIADRAHVHDEFFDHRPFPTPRRGAQFVGEPFDEHDRPRDPEHARVLIAALAGRS
jgi:protein O-GlcNAc transferase